MYGGTTGIITGSFIFAAPPALAATGVSLAIPIMAGIVLLILGLVMILRAERHTGRHRPHPRPWDTKWSA